MPTNYNNIIKSFFNPKLLDVINKAGLYNYQNLTVQWCKTLPNCSLLIKSGKNTLRQIDIMRNFQNSLPSLGDYIFGVHNQREFLEKFYQFTTDVASEFYDNKVSNISLIDLPAFGAIGKGEYFLKFYLKQIRQSVDKFDEFFSLIYDVVLNTSLNHPCKNISFFKFCNIQTENIIAKNLKNFFKIMFISSTINTNYEFSDIIKKLANTKAFKDKFRVLNFSEIEKRSINYPIFYSGFKQTILESDDDGKTMNPTLTPFGLCSSFNSLSHNQLYVDSEYSDTWTSVTEEKYVKSNSLSYL